MVTQGCSRLASGLVAFAVLAVSACVDLRCPLEPCDIRESSCQRAAFEAARCVRGDTETQPVAVRVVDADQYTEEQIALAEQRGDAERLTAWYRGLELFGLSTRSDDVAAATRSQVDNIAAIYSREERAITVLDRGQSFDSFGYAKLLVHEMVHAMQDADHGIEALYETAQTFDQQLALSALIEGEATFYADLAHAHAFGYHPRDIDLDRAFSSYRARSLTDLNEADEPLLNLYSYFAYAFGGTYVHAVWKGRGNAGVRGLWMDPPRSQREVMRGPSAQALEADTWYDTDLVDRALPMIAGAWELVDAQQLGCFAVLTFLQRARGRPAKLVDAALGVEADVFSVQRDGERLLAAWRIRFEDARTAHEIARYENSMYERGSVEGRDLLLLRSRPFDVLEAADAALAWTGIPASAPQPQRVAAPSGLHCAGPKEP